MQIIAAITLAIGDTDTGIRWLGNGDLAVYTNNVARARFNGNGVTATAVNMDILRQSDLDPFFTGGCGNNQYITSISSTGQISCAQDTYTAIYQDRVYTRGDNQDTNVPSASYFCSLAGMAWSGAAPAGANCAVFMPISGGSWFISVQPENVACRITCFRYN